MRNLMPLCFAALLVGGAAGAAEPLKIGVLEDMSGVYADITGEGSVAAAELAIADFGGEVLGRKIELVSADHQNKADIGSTTARRWYDNDGVEMITGIGNSAVALAVREVARDKGKIDISTSAAIKKLTNEACSPTGFHWVYDTYSLAKSVASASVKAGGDKVFFVGADYAFGHALAEEGGKFARQAGGEVVGEVFAPLSTSDYSSFVLQAQGSGANNVGLALAGGDLVNFIKQASQFAVVEQGQNLSAFIFFIQDVHALTLPIAKGLYMSESFYWDLTPETRAFAERFYERTGKMPNSLQAGVYSAVNHYLKAVQEAGTTEAAAVAEKMRELPVNDFYTKNAVVRADGRVMRDMYLFEVKAPEASSGEWDLMELIATVPGEEAFQPLAESNCPLVAAKQ